MVAREGLLVGLHVRLELLLGLLDEAGHLAQHVVAGHVAATVVDGLEAVEVHVEQHVHSLFPVRTVHGLVETAFEFATVDEARERVMGRLVAHFAGQSAELGHVVDHDHRAGNAVAGAANR